MTKRTAADRKAWRLVLEACHEANVGLSPRDHEYMREEDRADEERIGWSSYGETQELPDGDEPPTEEYLA